MTNLPELPPYYTVVDLRETEHIDFDSDDPYHARLCGELVDEFVERKGGSYWAERSEAVAACWAHFREYGPPQWVEFLLRIESRLPNPGPLTKVEQ